MILIIGGGLSGLLIAYRLKKQDIPFKVLEARSRIGGRINTVYGTAGAPMEMGATWFGDYHKHLVALLHELKIEYYEQYMEGTVFFQPLSTSPAQSIQIPIQPPSYRILGGSSHLINTLYKGLDPEDVLLNKSVRRIKFLKNAIQVTTEEEVFTGTRIVLAIPPKLWAKKILFEPNLPYELIKTGAETHTWMEDSIKVALTYNQDFWKKEGLSGTLFSNSGPFTELYDHCNRERSTYALCGFINSAYKNFTYEERQTIVLNQLTNVFGTKAKDFIDYRECIWSEEKDTYQTADISLFPHQNNGNPIYNQSFFEGRMFISSAEAATEFPGYMDGAVSSANSISKKLINNQ